MNKKAVVSMYIVFIIVAMVIILITAVFAPMGVLFNTEMYAAGEDILLRANESIQNINDAEVRAAVQDNVDNAFLAQENNIEVNANLFQYGWILILGLVALVIFLFTRRMVEMGAGGFV